MARFGTVAQQYFDASGKPLGGGKLYFYEPGTTTTKTVYSDADETTSIAQPVVLDASGYQPDIFFSGQAKVVLDDADDVQIDVADPVGTKPAEQFPFWDSATLYSAGAVVQGSNDSFYQSLGGSNQNNDPTSTTGFWVELDMFREYSSSATYNAGMIVYYSSNLYYCESDDTSGVTPSPGASEWTLLSGTIDLSTYTLNGTTAEFNAALSDGDFATLSGSETLTNKTIDSVALQGSVTEEVYTITDGASVDIDPANGTVQQWTLTDDRTPAVSIGDGQYVMLMIDDGSNYSVTWTNVDQWSGGNAPTLPSSGYAVLVLFGAGGVVYGARVGDMSA